MQTLIPYKVSTTQLFLQDKMINLDDLTELADSRIFKLDQLPTKSYEKDFDTQMDITIEMNRNQLVIARDGYTVLDYFSDIGGMQSMMINGCSIILVMWNYNHLDNFLVTKLYRKKAKTQSNDCHQDDDQPPDRVSIRSKAESLKSPNFCMSPFDFFCDKLPNRWQCCRSTGQSVALKTGRRYLRAETNICNMVRQQRYYDKALEILLTEEVRKRI